MLDCSGISNGLRGCLGGATKAVADTVGAGSLYCILCSSLSTLSLLTVDPAQSKAGWLHKTSPPDSDGFSIIPTLANPRSHRGDDRVEAGHAGARRGVRRGRAHAQHRGEHGGQGHGHHHQRVPGRGAVENKRLTDVESPPPSLLVCMSEGCSE